MGSIINQFGGQHNAELNKATCNVLVYEVPSGQKYKYVSQFVFSTSFHIFCKDVHNLSAMYTEWVGSGARKLSQTSGLKLQLLRVIAKILHRMA